MYKVVVIDDEYFTRQALIASETWAEKGFEIIGEAECGLSGLEIIKEMKPDLAIVDIAMPKMDGMTMVKEVRRFNTDIFIIMLTGYNDFSFVQESIRAGVVDYLLKPIQEEELGHSLSNVAKRLKEKVKPEQVEAPMMIRDKKDYLMMEIIEFIEENYSDIELSIDKICETLSYNYHYLSKVFKEKEGISLGKYIFQYRMEKSKEIIDNGECFMNKVAIKVGYEDELYFMKCFKRHFGNTPSQYIKIKKGER